MYKLEYFKYFNNGNVDIEKLIEIINDPDFDAHNHLLGIAASSGWTEIVIEILKKPQTYPNFNKYAIRWSKMSNYSNIAKILEDIEDMPFEIRLKYLNGEKDFKKTIKTFKDFGFF